MAKTSLAYVDYIAAHAQIIEQGDGWFESELSDRDCGGRYWIFVGFGSGLVENNPDSAGTAKYYGFPFAWRAVDEGGQKYAYPSELLADCVFGVVSVSIVAGTAMLTMKWMGKKKAQPSGNVVRRKKAGGTKRKANVGRFVFEILYTLESSRNGSGWHFG